MTHLKFLPIRRHQWLTWIALNLTMPAGYFAAIVAANGSLKPLRTHVDTERISIPYFERTLNRASTLTILFTRMFRFHE